MMTPERQATAVDMLRLLRADLEDDMKATTTATAGVAIGHLGAQVDALARVLIAMLEEPS